MRSLIAPAARAPETAHPTTLALAVRFAPAIPD